MVIFCTVSALLNFCTSFFLALTFIFNRSKFRDYICFNLSISIWSLFYFLWQMSHHGEMALLYCQLLSVAALLIPYFFIRFVANFLGIQNQVWFKKYNQINSIVLVLLIPLSFTPLIISGLAPMGPFALWPNAGPLYFLYLLFFSTNLILAFIHLFKNMFDLRVRYILFATLIGFSGGITNFFYWYNIPIPPVGTILTSVYVILIAYAISHIRLLDIDRFFKFSAYFFVLYIAIVLPFSALISFIKSVLLPYIHPYMINVESVTTSLIIDSILWTLFIVGSYLILKLLERQTDRFLFMGDYSYVDSLDRISRIFRRLPA